MRTIIVACLGAALAASSACAADISLKLDDGGQNAVGQLPAMFDQCIAGMTLRNDPVACRSVSMLLTAFANEVKGAQAAAAKAAADEAAKKAADDAAKAAADKPSPPAAN